MKRLLSKSHTSRTTLQAPLRTPVRAPAPVSVPSPVSPPPLSMSLPQRVRGNIGVGAGFSGNEWTSSLEWIGHGVVYFTMFYCSMNWLYYRNTRKDLESLAKKAAEEVKEREAHKKRLEPPPHPLPPSSRGEPDR